MRVGQVGNTWRRWLGAAGEIALAHGPRLRVDRCGAQALSDTRRASAPRPPATRRSGSPPQSLPGSPIDRAAGAHLATPGRFDGYALDRHRADLARHALSERRQRPERVRLQRVHAIHLRAVRRERCRGKCASSIGWETGEAGGAGARRHDFLLRRPRPGRRTWRSRSAATSSSTRRARRASCAWSTSAPATGRRGSSARAG